MSFSQKNCEKNLKNFDGNYRYYFRPAIKLLGGESGWMRFVSSFLTFVYIFIWHGLVVRDLQWIRMIFF